MRRKGGMKKQERPPFPLNPQAAPKDHRGTYPRRLTRASLPAPPRSPPGHEPRSNGSTTPRAQSSARKAAYRILAQGGRFATGGSGQDASDRPRAGRFDDHLWLSTSRRRARSGLGRARRGVPGRSGRGLATRPLLDTRRPLVPRPRTTSGADQLAWKRPG